MAAVDPAGTASRTPLRGRDLVSIADLSRAELERVFARSLDLKREYAVTRRHPDPPLAGRTLAMLFQHPSLRTRVTFEAGMTQLGGHGIYLAAGDVGLGERETVSDVARNLERFVDGIMARVADHDLVAELASHASIPVINALTDREHPCQALADLLTIGERFGRLDGLVLAFVGDGNNVFHSLALAGAMCGMEIRLAHPEGYGPDPAIVAQARRLAQPSGAQLVVERDPRAVVRGAAVVYTDAWTSMGHEAETAVRRINFAAYRVDAALMEVAGPDAVAMHCLPAHRGEEITDAVMDGPRSLIWEQSENRLHAQKGLLAELLGDDR
ncbi:MAG: ornithine carbamoyltransferase [Candidatus Limnocylindrales bacterium]